MSLRSSIVGTLCAVVVFAAPLAVAHAKPEETKETPKVDPQTRDKSRAAFRRGVAQLRAQDWAAARASFEEAWSLVQHPSILLNLGIARLRTDDPVLAEQDLVRFLSEDSGAGNDELASARDALAEARSKIGTLHVIVDKAAARVTVDGKPLAVRSQTGEEGVADARLKAGAHRVAVEAEGFLPDERSVDVPAKSETETRFTLTAKEAPRPASSEPPPAAPPTESIPTRTIVGWSLAGTSGVALVASGVMGLVAMSRSSAYEDRTDIESFQNPDVKSSGVAFRTGADVALVTAILAGAGAAILLLTDVGTAPSTRSGAPGTVSSGASSRARRIVRLAGGTLIDW